jgi:hypothetical protein
MNNVQTVIAINRTSYKSRKDTDASPTVSVMLGHVVWGVLYGQSVLCVYTTRLVQGLSKNAALICVISVQGISHPRRLQDHG